MTGLLADGDPPDHVHILPNVPSGTRPIQRYGRTSEEGVELVNAVGACEGCGQLFVTRRSSDFGDVHWRPLRWWHRKAHRKLAAQCRKDPGA